MAHQGSNCWYQLRHEIVSGRRFQASHALRAAEFSVCRVSRSALQEFIQDENVPGILYNHDNEFLHYQDDWYIIGQRENE